MSPLTASRIAILTDIHGNDDALIAVLKDAARHDPELYVFGGDLAVNGPRPAEALARIIEMRMPSVMGNMDDLLIRGGDIVGDWTERQLSADQIDYLRALPFSQRITPPNGESPHNDLLIVHSTPRSPYDVLILEVEPLGTSFTQTTPAAEAIPMLNGERADLITYGHIHYASSGVIGGQRILSVGSVGFPFDGDQRAAYAIAQWDGQRWQVTHHRVAYDYERVIQQIEGCGMPYPKRFADMIAQAKWLPRPTN
ncbi:MAG: metallophosphoesterase family protein [Anaerolineae bacterium]|nr:metallophosphoesterase family protein [Anaerolineae bacterium]